MSPRIQVDDEVYEYLQSRARPFEDTPNTVLRRQLKLDSDTSTDPREPEPDPGPQPPSSGGSVSDMRQGAVAAVERALTERLGRPTHLVQRAADGSSRRGPREQRYVTPGGQVIYIRTRSYDEEKLPFFTMQPATLEDADWYVFVCGGRGDVVAPAQKLRDLGPGLHKDSGGDYKPTFILDRSRCEIYAYGEPQDVRQWRDAYEAIAEHEVAAGRLGPG